MEKQIKEIIRSIVRENFVNEMSQNDVHVKEIMKFYDKGTYSTKKAISIYVCGKTNATRRQIIDELGDMGYKDVWDVMDHFKLDLESVQVNEGLGSSLAKIKSLAIKMATTKYDRAQKHLKVDKIVMDKFNPNDAMDKATSALASQTEIDEDLKSAINNIAVKLGTAASMGGILTAFVSISGWLKYLDSSFTKWYYSEIQHLAEPAVMKIMQDMGNAGKAEGSIWAKFGMYAFFIFFTIAVISLVVARMTKKSKDESSVNEIAVKVDNIPGGLASGKTMKDFVQKYDAKGYYHESQMAEYIAKKIKEGTKVEMEHTSDPKIAFEIAKDHIWEDLKYYDKLAKVEEYIDKKGVEHVAAALPQTEEEPVDEARVLITREVEPEEVEDIIANKK